MNVRQLAKLGVPKDCVNAAAGADRNGLAKKGIEILSAGADEVPGVYKNINEVMDAQSELVEKVARFEPRMVKMCGDGSKPED